MNHGENKKDKDNNMKTHQLKKNEKGSKANQMFFVGNQTSLMPALFFQPSMRQRKLDKALSSTAIQAKSTIDAPHSTHEKEADSIANAFTQSQNKEYNSSALQMRSNMRITPITNPAIQRSVKTWGGEWDTTKYEKVIPATAGGGRGAEIELNFQPGNMVNAELIGLIQTTKAINQGKVTYIGDPTRESHGIKSANAIEIDKTTKETDEGTHIDQVGYNRNPLYAVEGAPNADKNLSDTLPVAGDVTKSNSFGRHGFRYKDGEGNLKEQDAFLYDRPLQLNVDKDSSNIFEVAALAIKGNQNGIYYGSIQWGWRTDSKGNHDLMPLKAVSQAIPTSSFLKAGELWNSGQTSTPEDTLDLITKDVKVTTKQIYEDITPSAPPIMSIQSPPMSGIPRSIPAGTRVQIIFFGASLIAGGEKPPQIKVVDGSLTGTTIAISKADMANLRAERP